MRNYIEMMGGAQGFDTHAGPTGTIFCWGSTDEQLFHYMIRNQALVKAGFPMTTFGPLIISDIYWLLNAQNLGVLLNGPNTTFAEYVYNGTHAPGRTADDNTFWGISQIKRLQGSPRKVWSHGH